jgi:hypothetical protein
LEIKGYTVTFTDNSWQVTKGSLITTKREKVGTLYLCTSNVDSFIALVSTGENTTLWRQRLKNMSVKGMKIIHSRNLLPDLK